MTRLDAVPPTFTTGTALRLGLHRRDLYRARDDGGLNELSRGVFRKADAPEPSFPDLLARHLTADPGRRAVRRSPGDDELPSGHGTGEAPPGRRLR